MSLEITEWKLKLPQLTRDCLTVYRKLIDVGGVAEEENQSCVKKRSGLSLAGIKVLRPINVDFISYSYKVPMCKNSLSSQDLVIWKVFSNILLFVSTEISKSSLHKLCFEYFQ